MVWKILLYTLIGYITLLAALFLFQRKLLYLPDNFRPSKADLARERLTYWPSTAHYRGFVAPAQTAAPQGTIVLFHGNAGAAFHRSFYIPALSQFGMRILLAEYPGYGGRPGRPSEQVLVEDAITTVELAYQQYGAPLYLWGESLGCGVVSSVVRQTTVPLKGVVLFLPWDSLPAVAQTHYWFFPARWLVLDTYNNMENLQQYTGRIAVLLAEQDEVIPVRHGMKLYESISTDKRLWIFQQTRHNEVPIQPELPWWQEVAAYLTE